MLPFGSITSIVPLFLLAFAYILYFSAAHLNKNNAVENKVPEEKTLFVEGSNGTSLPDFREVDDQEIDEGITHTKFNYFPDLILSSLRLPPGGKTSALYKSYSFSPRPPPIQI